MLYVGISDAPAWFIAHANAIAAERGWTPFVAVQMQYSLLERSVEHEHLPMTRALDLALTAWSPLGGGMLTGKYRRNSDPSNGDGRFGNSADSRAHFLTDRNFEIVEAAVEVAESIGATPPRWRLRGCEAGPAWCCRSSVLGARASFATTSAPSASSSMTGSSRGSTT